MCLSLLPTAQHRATTVPGTYEHSNTDMLSKRTAEGKVCENGQQVLDWTDASKETFMSNPLLSYFSDIRYIS